MIGCRTRTLEDFGRSRTRLPAERGIRSVLSISAVATARRPCQGRLASNLQKTHHNQVLRFGYHDMASGGSARVNMVQRRGLIHRGSAAPLPRCPGALMRFGRSWSPRHVGRAALQLVCRGPDRGFSRAPRLRRRHASSPRRPFSQVRRDDSGIPMSRQKTPALRSRTNRATATSDLPISRPAGLRLPQRSEPGNRARHALRGIGASVPSLRELPVRRSGVGGAV